MDTDHIKIWGFVSYRQFLEIGYFQSLRLLLQPALPRFFLVRLLSLAISLPLCYFAFTTDDVSTIYDVYDSDVENHGADFFSQYGGGMPSVVVIMAPSKAEVLLIAIRL
jgi:hypothetical protein